ncbi:MAG: homocysteine S-methyltransferase family protein [Bacillota bacterium]
MIFDKNIEGEYRKINPKFRGFIEFANITDSETIIRLHKESILSGVNAIRTNTLRANTCTLKVNRSTIGALIARGYKNAFLSVPKSYPNTVIFASIGELTHPLHKNALDEYKFIIDIFIKSGATAFSFENFTSLNNISEFTSYIKENNKNTTVHVTLDINMFSEVFNDQKRANLFREAQKITSVNFFFVNSMNEKIAINELSKIISLSRKKTIIVEMPKSQSFEVALDNSSKFLSSGADLISISESYQGAKGIDSTLLSAKIKREVSAETMPHLISSHCSPDMFQSKILALHMEKIRNVFALSGENTNNNAQNCFDFSSTKMIESISHLNKTTLYHDPIICSAAFNPNALDIDIEIDKLRQKILHGVTQIITCPITTSFGLDNINRAKTEFPNVKLLCGVQPSLREVLDFIRISKNFCDGFYVFSNQQNASELCKIISEIKKHLVS